jgi:uncharacterized membrane protein
MTPPQEPQREQQIQAVGVEAVRDQDKIHLVLAYLGCLCLIPYLTVKDSELVAWHARQGLVLLGAEVVLSVLAGLLIPIGGGCWGPLLELGLLGVSIFAILRALKGERWRLPMIADLADKLSK